MCLFSLYVVGRVEEGNTVHHIVEILDNKELAYEEYNLIPFSSSNHETIHKLYRRNKLVKQKVQELLIKMTNDFKNGDKTLGKYKNEFMKFYQ